MSKKRDLIASVLPRGLPFSKSLNNNAIFVDFRRSRFGRCPEYPERSDLYVAISKMVDEPIDYLEFGVWQGASIDAWRKLNGHPESRFVGFDTFEGLPEDWNSDHPKGTFSTQGAIPTIDDKRVSFVKGLFQHTLRPYLASNDLKRRLVINVDCDIYSATLFVLGTLDHYFASGTIIIFDDFYSMNDEFAAFVDYDRSFGRSWNAIGKLPNCIKAAIEIRS
jgi:O-methyltransferase